MSLLLKNVRLVTGTGRPAKPQDLAIRDGVITALGADLPAPKGTEVWDFDNAHVSPGWFDVGVQTGDPGFEHREDLGSVTRAAAAGGFTAIACWPNTHPAIHAKSEVLYVKNKTATGPVACYPIGAISQETGGQELAELYDMHAAGALAFSDGSNPVQDAGLLLRALQYVKAFNGLVINQPHHKSLAGGGQMHEGLVSTRLGLKGLPDLAEEIMVQRDLRLLEYAGSRLHLHLLSGRRSVELVRQAKAAGLPVTASVAMANLCFTDALLGGRVDGLGGAFDANWKVLPPLRSADDRAALLEGLADGAIDFICSNHAPWDEEAKNLEFPYAEFGMIGLETAFALGRTFLAQHLSLAQLVDKLAYRPRQVMGLPVPELRVGAVAELTVFDPDATWVLEEKNLRSKARNTPFGGQELTGRVLGIVGRGQAVLTGH